MTQPETVPARGVVWSSTVVHIRVGTHEPPYGLAYVDLTERGPRVLVLLEEPRKLGRGTEVDLSQPSDPSTWATAREVQS